MKRLLILSCFISLFSLISAQTPGQEKWKMDIIKNGVKSQTQWNHRYKKDKPEKDGYINVKTTYDKNGNIIEELYFKHGEVHQRMTYSYDENDRKVEYTNIKGDKTLYQQNFIYDSNGNKIKEIRFDGSQLNILRYEYKDGKLLEIKKYDGSGKLNQRRKFSYDGQETTVNIYDEASNYEGKVVNTYDANGNLIETVSYSPEGMLSDKTTYKYNNDNQLTQKTRFQGEEFVYKENYIYDTSGNLEQVIKEENSSEYINNKYEYDNQGKLLEEQWYDNHPEDYSKKTYFYKENGLLDRVEVFYAVYNYRLQYRFKYDYY